MSLSSLLGGWSIPAAFIVCLLAYIYRRNSRYWISRGLPSASYIPLIGSLWNPLSQKVSLVDFFVNCYKQTDFGVFGMFIFHKPGLLIRDPEIIKHILVKDFQDFPNRYSTPNHKDDPVGTSNLIFMKGQGWVSLRKQMSAGFTPIRIKALFGGLMQIGDELNQFMAQLINDTKSSYVIFDAREVLGNFMTDAIGLFAFGIKANSINNPNAELRTFGKKIFQLKWYRMLEWLAIFFLPQVVNLFKCKIMEKDTSDFISKVTHEVVSDRERSGDIRNDFIDLLVKLKNSPVSEDQIKIEGDVMVAQTSILFAAGFDTTTSLSAMALYELALNPECQKILREEIQDSLKKYDGEITHESITEMTYLDMVLAETLRKYPPLAFLDRECKKPGGYRLPEPYQDITIECDSPIFIPVSGIHWDPKYYPDPQRFDPERFSKDAKQSRHPYCYLPFGSGPRTCLGERLGVLAVKIAMVSCLKDYVVSTCSKTPNPMKFDPKSLLLNPLGGLSLKFEKSI